MPARQKLTDSELHTADIYGELLHRYKALPTKKLLTMVAVRLSCHRHTINKVLAETAKHGPAIAAPIVAYEVHLLAEGLKALMQKVPPDEDIKAGLIADQQLIEQWAFSPVLTQEIQLFLGRLLQHFNYHRRKRMN